jgi:hypothetical protein
LLWRLIEVAVMKIADFWHGPYQIWPNTMTFSLLRTIQLTCLPSMTVHRPPLYFIEGNSSPYPYLMYAC